MAGQFAIVEPNVPMDALVSATLPYGLVPAVIMEFPGITVGGGVQGGAGESSSFRWGLFHEICHEYELVLGDGTVTKASEEENHDLFHANVGSYGSMDIITSVKISLIPAKKYVRLKYIPTGNVAEAVKAIQENVKENVGFVDAIQFSKEKGVVMSGDFSDEADLPKSRFRMAWNAWFYQHAKKVVKKGQPYEELIPIQDYLFRYDRGAFWVGDYGFGILHLPNIWLFRFLLHSLFTTRTLYRFLHATNASGQYIVQDLCLPEDSIVPFAAMNDDLAKVYPLWLCPIRPDDENKLSPSYIKTKLVINVGVWGKYVVDSEKFIETNRKIEQQIKDLGGRKVLYAHAYYTEDEFWSIYDKEWYDKTRRIIHASSTFYNIYNTVVVKEKIQSSRLTGLMGLIKSPFKIQ